MTINIQFDNRVWIEPNDVIQASVDAQISRPVTFKATIRYRDQYASLRTGQKILVTSYARPNELRTIGRFYVHMIEPSSSAETGRVFQITGIDEATNLMKKTGVPNKVAFDALTFEETINRITSMVMYDHLQTLLIWWNDRSGVDHANISTSSSTNMLEVLTAATAYIGYQFRIMQDYPTPTIEIGNFGFARDYTFVERDDNHYELSDDYLESQGVFKVERWSALEKDDDVVDSLYVEGGNYTVTWDEGQDQELLLTTSFEFGVVPDGYAVDIIQTPWRDGTYFRPIMAVRTDRTDYPASRLGPPPRNTRRIVIGGIVPYDPPGGGGPNGVQISEAAQMLLQAAIRYFKTVGSPKVTVRMSCKRDIAGLFRVGDKVKTALRMNNVSIPQTTLDEGLYVVSYSHNWDADGVTTDLEVCTQLDALTDPLSLLYQNGHISDRMITLKKYPYYQQRLQLDETNDEIFHVFPEVYHVPPNVEILSVSGAATAQIVDIRRNYVHITGTGHKPVIVTVKVTPKS